MLQNPNNASHRGMAPSGKNTGNLKRDINLLPKNENSAKMARMGLIALAAAVCVAALAYAAILLPNSQLKEKQDTAAGLSAQASAKAESSAQFDSRVVECDALKTTLDTLEASKSILRPADLTALISKACPDSITVLSITLSGAGAAIDGRAPDDRAVAQFIENLKAINLYQGGVELSSVQDYGGAEGAVKMRFFQIAAAYLPAAVPTPQPTAAPAAAQEGGDGA